MSVKTAAEVLNDYKDVMGAELGLAFHHCRQRLISTTTVWDYFEVLFSSGDRVALLNKTCGGVAFYLQQMLLESVVLQISKLLDRPYLGGQKNLTLELLIELSDGLLRDELIKRIDELRKRAAGQRFIRNKRIAHNDHDFATKIAGELEFGTRSEITHILVLILQFLNVIELHYAKSVTSIIPLGDADAFRLLGYLQRGVFWQGSELNALKSGDLSISDRVTSVEFLKANPASQKRYE